MKTRIFKKLFFFFIITMVTSTIYSQKTLTTTGVPKILYDEIKIESIQSFVIVPIMIKGGKYRFLLDTGSPNIISTAIFEKLNSKDVRQSQVTDANNKVDTINQITIPKIKIGKIVFKETKAIVFGLKSHEAFRCLNVDGIIGSNALKDLIVNIDLKDKVIKLTNTISRIPVDQTSGIAMSLRMGEQNAPFFTINFGKGKQQQEQVLFDTGSKSLYSISHSTVEQLNDYTALGVMEVAEGANAISIFGNEKASTHSRVFIPELKIANTVFEHLMATSSNTGFSSIGNEILNYGTVTIDFKNKKFYFESEQDTIATQQKQFGLDMTLVNDQFVVGLVWDEMLKEILKFGDSILKIDGKDLSEIKTCEIVLGPSLQRDSVELDIETKTGERHHVLLKRESPKIIEFNLLRDVFTYINAIEEKNAEKIVHLTYPKLVQALGGKKKLIDTYQNESADKMVSIAKPGMIYQNRRKFYSIITKKTTTQLPDQTNEQFTYVVAISEDLGATWKFMDSKEITDRMIKEWKLDILLPKTMF